MGCKKKKKKKTIKNIEGGQQQTASTQLYKRASVNGIEN